MKLHTELEYIKFPIENVLQNHYCYFIINESQNVIQVVYCSQALTIKICCCDGRYTSNVNSILVTA